jgi:hypothetical protein
MQNMRRKISITVLVMVLLAGAYANFQVVSDPPQRVAYHYTTEIGEQPVMETNASAMLAQIGAVNVCLLLVCLAVVIVGRIPVKSLFSEARPKVPDKSDFKPEVSEERLKSSQENVEAEADFVPSAPGIERIQFLCIWIFTNAMSFLLVRLSSPPENIDRAFAATVSLGFLGLIVAYEFAVFYRLRNAGLSTWLTVPSLLPFAGLPVFIVCLFKAPMSGTARDNKRLLIGAAVLTVWLVVGVVYLTEAVFTEAAQRRSATEAKFDPDAFLANPATPPPSSSSPSKTNYFDRFDSTSTTNN